MSKFKSLSDSSTSESEDDYGKRLQNQLQFNTGSIKRSLSNDDTEDEPDMITFKSPLKYSERLSTDDTEDENLDTIELPPNKRMALGFKNPLAFAERDISDSSENEEKPNNVGSNMPSMETLNGNYGVGMKLMAKMGYKSGTGLGKYEQGRVNIVEASKQRGRRGLGLKLQAGLQPSTSVWEAGQEEEMISVVEEVSWMPDCNFPSMTIAELREWTVEGEKKVKIDDETEFVDPVILKKILDYKSIFDELEPEEMRKARTRSNPFETIRGGIFLNRAAMKMANIDAIFDFMFTNPKNKSNVSTVGKNELLYFADVCAGPGGFSEYVLWRKKWEAKGFGFTLKGQNDFKLDDFFSGPPETFEPYYGVNDDGNIYAPENLRSFSKFVHENTDNKGVHFMMADGGFSVEGCENEQEILSKRLYLCQFLCALLIVRTDGHFVCKLFDLFTPFSVGLVYLMCMAFEKVCIFKPNTSRPANSERYIICKWKKENTKDICDYMYEVNEFLDKNCGDSSTLDVREIVPLQILKQNNEFYEYICESNNSLGERQIIHLDKIRVFAQNENLHETRQPELRKACLEYWQVPDKVRSAPNRPDPKDRFEQLLQGENLKYLSSSPEILNVNSIKQLANVFDYYCLVCGECRPEQHASLFLGLGKSNIYRFDSKNSKWLKMDEKLELPCDTLFYGELILELKGEGRAQRKITCLHIIDAAYLGGIDVRNHHFKTRLCLAEKLAKAVSKPSKSDYTKLRVKEAWQFTALENIFDRLSMKLIKNASVPRLCFDLGDGRHILPTGLLIFKTTAEPWMTAFSKSSKRVYWFNTKKNISDFEQVEEANANFQSCFSKRLQWNWERGVGLIAEQNINYSNNLVHGHTILEFLKKRLMQLTGRSHV